MTSKKHQEIEEQAKAQMEQEGNRRIREHPVPTELEIRMGAFEEMLEPQVKDAVIEMNKKGYSTASSGFYGEGYQAVDGHFVIDDKTRRRLEDMGVEVRSASELEIPGFGEYWTRIQFDASDMNLQEMKEKWDAIADILPNLEDTASFSLNMGSHEFREQYAPGWRGIFAEDAVTQEISIRKGEQKPAETIEDLQAFLKELQSIRERSEQPEKAIEWAYRAKEIEHTTDKLDMPVDEGIKEAVIAMQVNGLPTLGSCEGHATEGAAKPYVDIASPVRPQFRFENEFEIYEEFAQRHNVSIKEIMDEEISEDVAKELSNALAEQEETSYYQEYVERNKKLEQRARAILEEFYKNRTAPPDVKLHIRTYDAANITRIEAGIEGEVLPDREHMTASQKSQLAETIHKRQAEMNAFTEFLKTRYFG